jgi:hypothetical protein
MNMYVFYDKQSQEIQSIFPMSTFLSILDLLKMDMLHFKVGYIKTFMNCLLTFSVTD